MSERIGVVRRGITKSFDVMQQPKFTLKIILLTAFLCLPGLFCDMAGDDYWFYGVFNGGIPIEDAHSASFEYFSIYDGQPSRTQSMVEMGMTPWWVYEGYKVMFWRPLTELTHWVDFVLWPKHGGIMHFHNLLWYLALIAVLSLLYKSTMTTRIAIGVALLAYAFDSGHGNNVGWIAARNGVVATFFGVLTLVAHIHSRENNHLLAKLLAPFFLVLALLAGEYGIAVGAYLFAYAVCLDKEGPVKGFVALLKYAVVVIVWWLSYQHFGYGEGHIGGGGSYIDPVTRPLDFIDALAFRLPLMLGRAWGFVPPEFVAGNTSPLFIFNGLVICGFLIAIWPLLKREKVARFWLVGTVLSALPICAAPPSARMFLFVSIGSCALIGMFLHEYFGDGKKTGKSKLIVKMVAGMLVLFHFVLEPLLLPLSVYAPQLSGDMHRKSLFSLSSQYELEGKRVVLINSPPGFNFFIPSMLLYHDSDLPKSIWMLTSDYAVKENEVTFEVLDNHRVSAELQNGFIRGEYEKTFRNLDEYPLLAGDTIVFSGFTVEVKSVTEDGHPKKVVYHFEQSIDHEDYLFFEWTREGYQRFELPRIGETRVLMDKPPV